MKRKALKGMILAAALAAFSGMTSLAMGWQMDDTGWWWLREDGTWLANTWAWIDGDGRLHGGLLSYGSSCTVLPL